MVNAELPNPGGRVRVVTRDNRPVADLDLGPDVVLELPERDKYFLYVELPSGSSLESVSLEPAT